MRNVGEHGIVSHLVVLGLAAGILVSDFSAVNVRIGSYRGGSTFGQEESKLWLVLKAGIADPVRKGV